MLPLLVLATTAMARAATLTVTNLTDPATCEPGDGSLRGEIAAAANGDTIVFAAGLTGTIDLLAANGPLEVATSITITGPTTSPGITISGQNATRVIVVASGLTVSIANLTIEDGSSGNGGGIFNNGTLTVTNCTLSDNTASSFGGGIDNEDSLTVSNSTFSGNSAPAGLGGGIDNDSSAMLTVTNSTFSDNSAAQGGGIFSSGGAAFTNCTFSGNSALGGGGGIANFVGALTVTNCTFSGDSAGLGAGVFNEFGSVAKLKGTILAAEPTGANCSNGIGAAPLTDVGYNISDDGSCGFTEAPTGTSINNSTTLHLDPAGLQNNGGPTQTIAIEPDSQAFGFIPVAYCTNQASPPVALTTDQRGFPRPDPGNPNFCDAGAFELQTGRLTVTPSSEKTQIVRSSSTDADEVNLAFTFTDHGSPTSDDLLCDAGNDALNGISVDLFQGTCASPPTGGLVLDLTPFVVHTVGSVSYGTILQSSPTVPSPETVSARIVQLETPDNTCGQWTLNIEVTGLDTAALGLTGNPFALVLEDSDKNEGCFDITNAIVGNQIDPPGRKVRRDVRR